MHLVAAVATAACNLRCLACGLLLLPLLLLSAACVAAAAWCWFCLQFTAAICSLLVAACVAVAACGLVLFCMHFQLLLQTVVVAAVLQPLAVPACHLLLLRQSAAAVCTVLLPLPLAADVALHEA